MLLRPDRRRGVAGLGTNMGVTSVKDQGESFSEPLS